MEADSEDAGAPGSLVARVTAYYQRQRDAVQERIEEASRRYPALGVAYDIVASDRQAGGALLAGALAFRLFLWLLPAGLVIVGCLGFLTPAETASASAEAGLGSATASTIAAASQQAQQGRWILLIVGLVTLYWTSGTLARTLWLATSLAWRLPVARFRGRSRAAAVILAFLVPALLLTIFANRVRATNPTVGLAVTLSLVVVYAALAWVVLWVLPHPRDVSPPDLLPGALLIGLGTQGLHLFSTLYLDDKLQSSSELYGGLGGAATILLWAYILARVLVAASTLNRVWVDLRLHRPGAVLASGPHPPWTWRHVPQMLGTGWRDAVTQVRASLLAPEVGIPRAALAPQAETAACVTAWTFDDASIADEAERLLRASAVPVRDSAVLRWPLGSRNPDFTPRDPQAPPGELGPAFWGLLFGLVFYAPLLDGSRQAAGLLGGSMGDAGLSERFAHNVRERIAVGTSALFVVSDAAVVATLRETLATLPHGFVRIDLASDQVAALHLAFAR